MTKVEEGLRPGSAHADAGFDGAPCGAGDVGGVIGDRSLRDPGAEFAREGLRVTLVLRAFVDAAEAAPELHAVELPLPLVVGSYAGRVLGGVVVPVDIAVGKGGLQRITAAFEFACDGVVGNFAVPLAKGGGGTRFVVRTPFDSGTRAQVGGQRFLRACGIVLLPCSGDGGELRTAQVECIEDHGFMLAEFGGSEGLRARCLLRLRVCTWCGDDQRCKNDESEWNRFHVPSSCRAAWNFEALSYGFRSSVATARRSQQIQGRALARDNDSKAAERARASQVSEARPWGSLILQR